MKDLYYKATLEGGQCSTRQEPEIIYRIGMVVHPNPDREDTAACGIGIHLAKTLTAAMKYVPKAKEFYLAEAGVVLGEDNDKIRCASCMIIRQIQDDEVSDTLFDEQTEFEKEKARGKIIDKIKNPLCGMDWLDSHWHNITDADIEACKLEVKTERGVVKLSTKLNKKDIRQVLTTVMAGASGVGL